MAYSFNLINYFNNRFTNSFCMNSFFCETHLFMWFFVRRLICIFYHAIGIQSTLLLCLMIYLLTNLGIFYSYSWLIIHPNNFFHTLFIHSLIRRSTGKFFHLFMLMFDSVIQWFIYSYIHQYNHSGICLLEEWPTYAIEIFLEVFARVVQCGSMAIIPEIRNFSIFFLEI